MMQDNDLISRADVLDLVQSYGPATYDMPYGSGDMIIRPEDVMALPAVDAAPVKHGRWQGVSPMVDSMECSVCRYCIPSEELKTPFCPWCGAEMDGGEDDADGETPLSAEWKNELRPVQADIDDAYYEYGRKHQEGKQ